MSISIANSGSLVPLKWFFVGVITVGGFGLWFMVKSQNFMTVQGLSKVLSDRRR